MKKVIIYLVIIMLSAVGVWASSFFGGSGGVGGSGTINYIPKFTSSSSIGDSSLSDDGINVKLVDRTVWFDGATGSTPTSGAGTRFMWIPSKAAIRAGNVNANQWDDALIGQESTAFGYSVRASGLRSVAMGATQDIRADYAFGVGASNTITSTGTYSVAMGTGINIFASASWAAGSNITIKSVDSGACCHALYIDSGSNQSYIYGHSLIVGANSPGTVLIGYGNPQPTIVDPYSFHVITNSDQTTLYVSNSGGPGLTGQVGIATTNIPASVKLGISGAIKIADGGTKPTCDATYRGTIWIDYGSAGVKDTVEVCAKDATDTYAWRTLY